MRDIPIELAARIESGAATLCHAWVVTRADGRRLGFTDHDRDLVVDGVVCRAASGWTNGAGEGATGLAAGSLAIGGGLDGEAVNEAEVVAGMWDQARVELWRVDWMRPDLRVRLTGLLRGQQGTGAATAAGALEGALVVVLDERLARVELAAEERGLPRIARVGPQGAVPGGPGFAELSVNVAGVHGRPWSPAGLAVEAAEEGVVVRWTPRVRIGGDRWDLDPVEVDPRRFRLRVLDGGLERRVMEVEALSAVYGEAAIAEDFPGGIGPGATVAVAQYGNDWGWGEEAVVSLAA